ncbi:MAG: shikimate dehydrogenase [Paraburkholderia tropica]|uniref:Shikimate 5-dehydrogenase n=1 Tax=Paraburkholderia tropica TaxID=92647 RepID=A0ABX5MRQ1_9BURK|nr:shikimate dehydrogenase [Paraburkholderia tropica]MBB3000442.1 shikimate 5-dehydrogenase [Paraburkholderia tropica]MBB6320071.1 shikimate 5-dehydrogenase [Paraburkholderia tropica]MDE1144692.1 shikimate dehydrogenase [Paraburkholderia tropica]PXX17582.1 shikimate 5-dehydrogenase [Paraburkholderia tropica]PZW84764.1 shikimate 5-dehydrogenase [Paraburkholderia tropica]
MSYTAATRPTFYFIGVTTAQSSIMRVFPEWARHLGLGDVEMKGIDFPLHASREAYREAVEFLRDDPLSLGALVTTHKIDLYAACEDLFDEIDPHARIMGETSCLSKRNGKFVCHAKDPITSGLALDGFLPPEHFARTGAEVFSMGAGGSTIALTWHLMQASRGANRPSRVIVSNRSAARLEEIERIHRELHLGVPCEYVVAPRPQDNDAVLARLSPGALVINATGLGKDAPGSPLTNAGVFPERAIAWDLNYRGELVFLDQARAQQSARALQVEDGWTYFIYGWTRVIAEVFHIDIPTRGPDFDEICRIAAAAGKPAPARPLA